MKLKSFFSECQPGYKLAPQVAILVIVIFLSGATKALSQCATPDECVASATRLPMANRVSLLLDALNRFPSNFPLAMYTSRVLLAEGDYQLALQTLDGARPPSGSAQTLLDEQRSIAILNLGYAAEANTALRPEAILSLSQRRFSLSLQLFIHSLIDLGEFNDARRYLGIVSSWRVDGSVRAAYLLQIARLADGTGDSETAIEALTESLQLQPNTLVRLFRALVFVWQDKVGAAQRQAKALSPEDLKPEFKAIPRLFERITSQNVDSLQRFQDQVSNYPQEQSGHFLLATYLRLSGDISYVLALPRLAGLRGFGHA